MPTQMTGDFGRYPATIRDQLPYLTGEVCELRQDWVTYRALFIEDQPYTEMMGSRLGSLLGVFQSLLQDEMLLVLSRLTDRDSKGQKNLSLWCLLDCAGDAVSPDFSQRLGDLLSEIDQASESIRRHRHKRLAHYDLKVSLKSAILPSVTFREIREQIERFEAALNLVFREFADTTMFFDILSPWDVTGKAEVTVRKAIAYDALEAEGIVPKLFWRTKSYEKEPNKRLDRTRLDAAENPGSPPWA